MDETPRLAHWLQTTYGSKWAFSSGSFIVEVILEPKEVKIFLQSLADAGKITVGNLEKFVKIISELSFGLPDTPAFSRPVNTAPFQKEDYSTLVKLKEIEEEQDKTLLKAIEAGDNRLAVGLLAANPGFLKKEFYDKRVAFLFNILEWAAITNNAVLVEKWLKQLPINRAIIQKKLVVPAILALLSECKYKTMGRPPSRPENGRSSYGAGISGIKEAMGYGHGIKAVKEWIDYDPNCLKDPDTFNYAINRGEPAAVKLLLEEGATLNLNEALLSLMLYAPPQTLQILHIILSFGVVFDSETVTKALKRALKTGGRAARVSEKETVMELIKVLVTLSIDWSQHQDAIVNSALVSFPDSLPIILGCTPKQRLLSTNIILTIARCTTNSIVTMRALFSRGVIVDGRINAAALDILLKFPKLDKNQEWLLHYLLANAPMNWSFLNENGKPLLHCLFPTKIKLIPYFCRAGAEVNQKDKDGLTLLHYFALYGRTHEDRELVDVLFAYGINPVVRGNLMEAIPIKNVTALQMARIKGNFLFAEAITVYSNLYAQSHETMPNDAVSAQEEQIIADRLGEPPLIKVCDQINSDILFLQNIIRSLRSGLAKGQVNGQELQGEALAIALDNAATEQMNQIRILEAMLASKVVPEKYFSPITKKIYLRTPEEAYASKVLPNAMFYLFCVKQSRKRTNSGMSHFFLHRDDGSTVTNFRVEHRLDKNYPSGGMSKKIKQGFIDEGMAPKYAVKVFNPDLFQQDKAQELRMAMRGGYCSRLLGRTGLVFRRNHKQYLIMDWYPGLSLSKVNPDFLKTCSIEIRIKMALDLTQQIAILHTNELIHCDIKPGNLIISDTSLNLVDLDSVRYKGEASKFVTYTRNFLDAQLNWDVVHDSNCYKSFDEKSDLYALGLTLAFLFPELFSPSYSTKTVTVASTPQTFEYPSITLQHGAIYHEHTELFELIYSLRSSNKSTRLGSADEFFDKLNQLYNSRYGQVFEMSSCLNKIEQSPSAKKTFEGIEAEIHEYTHRTNAFEEFKKEHSELLDLTSIALS